MRMISPRWAGLALALLPLVLALLLVHPISAQQMDMDRQAAGKNPIIPSIYR